MADIKLSLAGLLAGQSQGGLLQDLWRQPQDMGMLSGSAAYYPVPQPQPAYSGAVLPFSRDVFGNTSFDSNAGLLGLAKRAFTAPGDATSGRLPMTDASGHTSLAAIGRANDLAGLMTLGAGATPAEAGISAPLPPHFEHTKRGSRSDILTSSGHWLASTTTWCPQNDAVQ